ncbi:hypothetical protein ACPF8X_02755 [Streptomyces sp. G35A]
MGSGYERRFFERLLQRQFVVLRERFLVWQFFVLRQLVVLREQFVVLRQFLLTREVGRSAPSPRSAGRGRRHAGRACRTEPPRRTGDGRGPPFV